jgi:hypothetical protein
MGTKQLLKCSKYEERNAAELDRAEQQKKKILGANKNNSNCHSQFPKHAQGKSRENRDEYKDG